MKKFRAAVVGYGNIGKFTVEATRTNQPNWLIMM